jgi:hypothetical protein
MAIKASTRNSVLVAHIFTPSPLSVGEVRGHILATLNKYEKLFLEALEDTVATWNHPSDFDTKIRYARGNARVTATTDDPIWGYLNAGTAYRWALMSGDWESKTSPGSTRSRAGAGHVVMRGQRAFTNRNMPPRPGIEPREWTTIIADTHADQFKKDIKDAIMDGLRSARAKGKSI